MVPPQDSPTFHAVSSATPNSSVLGLPLSITSSASVTTAPSTQPPETEPRKLPSSSMTRLEPTGRGAAPQVSTTVASAPPRPFARHSSAALRMSSSRANICTSIAAFSVVAGISSRAGRAGKHTSITLDGSSPQVRQHPSRRLLQPRLRVAGAAASARKGAHQSEHGIQVVNRPQFVDVPHERADALGLGLETGKPQQGIEPDQPPTGSVQPVDLEGQPVVGIALEPIGDQQHDRALGEHPPRPELVEGVQRGRDAR